MEQVSQPNEDSIQVYVRIKPGCDEEAVVFTHNEIKLNKHTFGFDRIFPPAAEQEEIFLAVGKKLISHALDGYNSCVFVYGQTGSGKTFTMMGNNSGLMQRSFCQLFSKIDRMSNTECVITCSYYQIYNEQIIDLLDHKKDKKSLNIRQDVKRGVFVENLTEQSVMNSQKLIDCLNIGMKNRHIGQTMMNRQSSRSHSIFTISIAIKTEINGKKVLKTPKLHFVDLAGSQRQKMTMASGQRLKQAGNINKSLTTLGMVINQLASEKHKTHIPYRDSKLTTLLRDSLGGNSKTFIVATISTSVLCFQETLSTLNFANRAKMVKVKALVNQESLSTNIEHYKEQIKKLKLEILKLKSQKRVSFQSGSLQKGSLGNSVFEHRFEELTSKIQDLKANMMTPPIQNIINYLNQSKSAEQKSLGREEDPMVDENRNQNMEQQGNQLIEYMISNHDLLKKIHTTVQEYSELRDQLKSVEFSKRLPGQDIKTPSKFERDQYEQLLVRREEYIKELQDKIVSLKQISFKRESQNKQLRRKMMSLGSSKEESGDSVQKIKQQLMSAYKRIDELQMKMDSFNEERIKNQRLCQELQYRLKQSKQLYIYSEQKYENERFIRTKLQVSLKQLNKKNQLLQQEKREQIEQYISKMESLEEAAEDFESKQQNLKNQIEILNQTLQFNKRILKEYNEKMQESNKAINEMNLRKAQITQSLSMVQQEYHNYRYESENIENSLRVQNSELKNNCQILDREIAKLKENNQKIFVEYNSYKQENALKIAQQYEKNRQQQQISLQIQNQLDHLRLESKKNSHQYELKIFSFEKILTILKQQLSVSSSEKQMIYEKYQTEKRTWDHQSEKSRLEKIKMEHQIQQTSIVLNNSLKKISEMEATLHNSKNIVEQHQQLKKTYKDIIKQNYKLKGQYSHGSAALTESSRNQELISKVAFYEQKFKLMSMQFVQLQESTKKLKQKELNLLKKIQYYEQNQKLRKINNFNDMEQEREEKTKLLQLQNSQLKEQIAKLSRMHESLLQNQKKEDYSKRVNLEHQKMELEHRQQKIRKILQSAIKNWDHTKQNNCSGMNLEDMISRWQKIENESRKKLESLGRAIKRQQKLKSQNDFILKESIYLREKVEYLEKQINMEALGNPRKVVKIQGQKSTS